MSKRPRRQIQYPARFMPLDDGGPPPQMTPEVWREPPPVRRRKSLVAVLAPAVFFVNQEAAPQDTGEWRYQAPRVSPKKRLPQHEDLFAPIEAPAANPNDGLEAYFEPDLRRRRHPQQPSSFVEPPFVAPPEVDTGEWQYQPPRTPTRRRAPQHPPPVVRGDVEPGLLEPPQPQVQRLYRRFPQHPRALTEPAHVEPGAIDFLFDPPEILRRRKQPNLGASFFEAPFVAPASTDALEWSFRPPQQTWVPRQRKRSAAAAVASGVSQPTDVAAVAPWRQPRRPRFRVSHQLPGAANRDG